MVAVSPVEKGVGSCGRAGEVVWAAHGHNPCVLGDQRFMQPKVFELCRDTCYIAVCARIVVPKETDDIRDA